MTGLNFGALIEQAEAEGFSNEILPIGEYDVEIAGTSSGSSQGNKPQVGIRYRVLVGPFAGKSFWDNITLTVENPKAVAVFLRKMSQVGVSTDFIKTQTSVDVLAAAIQVGRQYHVTLGHREFNSKTYHDVKKVVALNTPIAAAPTVAAPVAAAPVVVAAVAPPAQPVAAVAAATVAEQAPTVIAQPAAVAQPAAAPVVVAPPTAAF